MRTTRRTALCALAGAPALFLPRKSAAQDDFPEIEKGPFTGTNVWTDAYLAAVAAAQGLQLVSFDRGLARIRDLQPLILGAHE